MSLTLILGNVATGKTTLALALCLSSQRTLIVDPMDEHAHKGHLLASDFDQLCDLFINVPVFPNPTTIVYHPNQYDRHANDCLFDLLYDCAGWTIFIDEVDRFCNAQYIPEKFAHLCNYRRHEGIDLILVARRTARINSELSALASEIKLFHQHEAGDLDYIRKSCGKIYAEKCRKLFRYQFLTAKYPPDPK